MAKRPREVVRSLGTQSLAAVGGIGGDGVAASPARGTAMPAAAVWGAVASRASAGSGARAGRPWVSWLRMIPLAEPLDRDD